MKFINIRVHMMIAIGCCALFFANGQNSIDAIASSYTKIMIETRDLDALMSLYADSVELTDPIWGGQEIYSKSRLSKLYKAVLDDEAGWHYTLLATAIDEANQTIILRGYVIDSKERRIDFNSNLSLENQLIVRQTDLVAYPVEDLAYSDRFKSHFRADLNKDTQAFLNAVKTFLKSFKDRDTDAFVAAYQDTVLYRDQLYGSADRFSRENLKSMFEPFFNTGSDWHFDIVTEAIDEANQTLMLKLNFPKQMNSVMGEYAGWYRFEKGKIVEQMDFSMYPIKDLLESPRFKAYFEQEQLEVKPKSNNH